MLLPWLAPGSTGTIVPAPTIGGASDLCAGHRMAVLISAALGRIEPVREHEG
jgi:hypothetical protein